MDLEKLRQLICQVESLRTNNILRQLDLTNKSLSDIIYYLEQELSKREKELLDSLGKKVVY